MIMWSMSSLGLSQSYMGSKFALRSMLEMSLVDGMGCFLSPERDIPEDAQDIIESASHHDKDIEGACNEKHAGGEVNGRCKVRDDSEGDEGRELHPRAHHRVRITPHRQKTVLPSPS